MQDNKQVEIWKNFCISRCKKFYNFMKPFYYILKYDEFTNLDIQRMQKENIIMIESRLTKLLNSDIYKQIPIL